jgi:hypothetical protein
MLILLTSAHGDRSSYDDDVLSTRKRPVQETGAESGTVNMMWLSLIASGAAVPLMYGVGPEWGLWLSMLVFAAAFTTFCLLYDRPLDRARRRIAAQLAGVSSAGSMSEEHQRLRSMKVTPTETDLQMDLTPMMLVLLVSGVAGAGFAIWGIVLRSS